MEQKTQGAKRRKYDASFKEEVMKMIHNGRSASEVAQSLGYWRESDLQMEEP